MDKKVKLSCIMIACDGLEITKPAIFSLRCTTVNPYEIILVDNYSQDMTGEWGAMQPDVRVVRSDKLIGYGEAINLGYKAVSPDSQYIAVLNNDLLFTNGWDQKLIDVIEHPEWLKEKVDKVGIAGPVSNNASGLQLLKLDNLPPDFKKHLDILGKNVERNASTLPFKYIKTGWLQGFCMMISRECFEQVGEWDTFEPTHHGFEDNDYGLRAELEGFSLVVCNNCFVFHEGQWTEKNMGCQEFTRGGLACREAFFDKWKTIQRHNKDGKISKPEKMKLVAGYRVKNVGGKNAKFWNRALEKMSEIADEIVIFNDNSIDDTVEIAEAFERVVLIYDNEFDELKEDRDREKLLQLCKSRNPDWIIITDGDEVLCEKCTREQYDLLMNPINPMTFGYYFRELTFWDSEEHIRADGTFGQMQKVPLFKNIPNQHIANVYDQPQGFHCNSFPPMKDINLLPTRFKLLHYGYLTEEDRKAKFEWYMEKDTKKDPRLIGNIDYRHLVDQKVDRVKYNPETSVSFTTIVKNEERQLHDFLSNYHWLFDEMILVDTGSNDRSRDIILYYKDYGVKLIDYKWNDDFASARNAGVEQCKSTHVYFMDLDERFGPATQPFQKDKFWIHRLIEQPNLCYLIPKYNYYLDPSVNGTVSNARLWKNLPEIRFEGLVHESVTKSVQRMSNNGNGPIVMLNESQPLLYHTNFLQDPQKLAIKLRYYTKLLQRQLAKNPNDAHAHHSMGLHFENEGDIEMARHHFKQGSIHEPRLVENWQSRIMFELRCVKDLIYECIDNIDQQSSYGQNIMYLKQHLDRIAPDAPIVGMPERLFKKNVNQAQG